MYFVMRASSPSLLRESTDSLIRIFFTIYVQLVVLYSSYIIVFFCCTFTSLYFICTCAHVFIFDNILL